MGHNGGLGNERGGKFVIIGRWEMPTGPPPTGNLPVTDLIGISQKHGLLHEAFYGISELGPR
jgi:hypothetical protein